MKQLFCILLLLFSLVVVLPKAVHAQSAGQSDLINMLDRLDRGSPGGLCIDPSGPVNVHISTEGMKDPIKQVSDAFVGPLNDLADKVVNPAANNVKNFLTNNLGMTLDKQCLAGSKPTVRDGVCRCEDTHTYNLTRLCTQIVAIPHAKDSDKQAALKEYNRCVNCVGTGPNEQHGVWTALGCVSTDLPSFIKNQVFGWGLSLAFIAAFGCIIYAAIQIQLSAGNGEAVKKASELLTSCISGLIFIIFSVFILKLIGVDILRIPGFGQ